MFLFKSEKVGFDRILLIAALLLLCIGLVVISSASSMEAQVKFDDAFYQTKKHIIAIGIALIE